MEQLDNLTRVVAIATDDTWVHVYPNVKDMLEHRAADEDYPVGPLEFFDQAGRRLVPLLDASWTVTGLAATADLPDPERLETRVRAVLRHVARYLQEHPDLELPLPDKLTEPAELLVRRLADEYLAGMLAAIEQDQSGQVQVYDPGGWFHNLMHAAGWDH